MRHFDEISEEALARGGTFDITGTAEVTDKKFWGFYAGENTIVASMSGIPVNNAVETEVSVLALLTNNAALPLFTAVPYRIPGYIITKVALTSGSLHTFLTNKQD